MWFTYTSLFSDLDSSAPEERFGHVRRQTGVRERSPGADLVI